jgi:hypothetical protein
VRVAGSSHGWIIAASSRPNTIHGAVASTISTRPTRSTPSRRRSPSGRGSAGFSDRWVGGPQAVGEAADEPADDQRDQGRADHPRGGHRSAEQGDRQQHGVDAELRRGDEEGHRGGRGHAALQQAAVDRDDAARAQREREAEGDAAGRLRERGAAAEPAERGLREEGGDQAGEHEREEEGWRAVAGEVGEGGQDLGERGGRVGVAVVAVVALAGEEGEEAEAGEAAEAGGDADAGRGRRFFVVVVVVMVVVVVAGAAVGDDVEEEAADERLEQAVVGLGDGAEGGVGEHEAGDGGGAEEDHRGGGAEQAEGGEEPPHGDGDGELMGDDGDLEGVSGAAGEVRGGECEAVGERVSGHAEDGDGEGGAVGAAGGEAERAFGDRGAEDAEDEREEGGRAGVGERGRDDLQHDEADDGDEHEVVERGHRDLLAAGDAVDPRAEQQRRDADGEDLEAVRIAAHGRGEYTRGGAGGRSFAGKTGATPGRWCSGGAGPRCRLWAVNGQAHRVLGLTAPAARSKLSPLWLCVDARLHWSWRSLGARAAIRTTRRPRCR